MVSRYLLESDSDEEATRESPEGNINEEATHESPEGCHTEEATLEFNEDTKSREEKSHRSQDDDKSNQEEIRNSGEGTSSEEPHPEYPPQSAGILNRRESSSRPENVAVPSNRRYTVNSLTGSSDQEEIMVPNTPESVINGHADTNGNSDNCEDSLGFGNQLCSNLEDLNPTSLYENSRDSHAGPSNGNDNDNKNSQEGNVEASNTTREDINEDTQDSSQDFFCSESISLLSEKTSSDRLEKNDQESLLEQSSHTHSSSENVTDSNDSDDIDIQDRRNDIINAAEDDNAVHRSWNERATSSEGDDNGDQPQTPRVVESSFLMNYDSHSERKLNIQSFPQRNVLDIKNFVNIFRKSDGYDISNPKTPEHALTPYIRSPARSNKNVSDPSDQTDSDFIDFQGRNSEMINVAQNDSASQESLDETAATRKRDTDSDRPPNPEVLGTPETSETSVTPEPLETPKSPGTPKIPNTPINSDIVSGFSDHSDRDNINFQESSNEIINDTEDDSTSEKNSDERTTTTERDDESDRPESSESTEDPYPLLTPRKRKLRSRSNKVFGPPDYSDRDNINFQESSNEIINDTEDDSTSEENSDERTTTTERDDDSDRPESSESTEDPYPLLTPRKRKLRSRSNKVFGPPDYSDSDNIDIQESSNEMINVAQEDDDRDLPGTSKAYKDSYQFKFKTSPLKRRMVDRNRSLQKSSNDIINEAKNDSTSQENNNKITTTRERDNDDSDQRVNLEPRESFFTQLELVRKRRISDNPELRSGLDNVAGPSSHSDYDNNNFQASSNTMINAAHEDDNIPKKNINERATIRESVIVDSNRLTTTSESSDGPYILSPRKRRTLDYSGLRSTSVIVPGPSDSDKIDVGQENMDERAIMTKYDTDNSYRPGTSKDSIFDVRVQDDSTDSSSSSSS